VGFNFLWARAGGERRDREWQRCGGATGAGRKMRVYTCQETRRLVHNIGGSCADRRGQKGKRGEEERKETRGWLSASRVWTGTQERSEHARTTCNWVQSSWFSCEISLGKCGQARPMKFYVRIYKIDGKFLKIFLILLRNMKDLRIIFLLSFMIDFVKVL
jgi:CRISPR/Cas system-associated endoribonuclease Cas2